MAKRSMFVGLNVHKESGIWRVPVEGGQKTLVLETPVHSWNWTLWKDNIVYLNAAAEEPRIEMLSLATGRVTEMAKPAPGLVFPWESPFLLTAR